MDDVHVIATSEEDTRRALAEAARREARVVVIVPHVVSFSPAAGDALESASLAARYRAIARSAGVQATVRVCLCRNVRDVCRSMVRAEAMVIVGGRRRAWWPTASQRLARWLRARGHDVVFV